MKLPSHPYFIDRKIVIQNSLLPSLHSQPPQNREINAKPRKQILHQNPSIITYIFYLFLIIKIRKQID
jgi:hypothetical protein